VARAGQLSQPTAPIAPETSNEDVHRLFSEQPQLETLAVVADDRPLGLINRQRFMEQYARPFARDVFGRRTCLVFTDTAPLVVAASLPMDQLVQQALASGNRVLKDGFITVEEGRYAGIGTGHALMACCGSRATWWAAMPISSAPRRRACWAACSTARATACRAPS
jgi:hypothetical protein